MDIVWLVAARGAKPVRLTPLSPSSTPKLQLDASLLSNRSYTSSQISGDDFLSSPSDTDHALFSL